MGCPAAHRHHKRQAGTSLLDVAGLSRNSMTAHTLAPGLRDRRSLPMLLSTTKEPT